MSSTTLRLSSPAKINLWLNVLGKREDGFHNVETRMCALSLHDDVEISPSDADISKLTCSDESLPTDESNLAMKALRAFEKRTGISRSWNLHLEKRVPHGAGLGGGSSNAAAVLLGLNQLCGNPLSRAGLSEIGGQLGSDIPFFLHDCVCDASGRGEIITPVPDFSWKLPVVLIKPTFGISTPWAYQHWANSQELPGVLYAPQLCPWGQMVNALERPVFEKWTLLPTLKTWLLDQKETWSALMSGSGSTMFAITESATDAASLAEKARQLCGETTWVHITSTQ